MTQRNSDVSADRIEFSNGQLDAFTLRLTLYASAETVISNRTSSVLM